jgi:DNA-directed RNA polymerase specialized sigma24 family protein/LysM repeat protein
MFDRDPELSPDLVWLLQSQQVEDGLLARMLVQETYAQLLPFWETLLGDPQKAQNAALETFSTALLKTNTFREPQTVRSWLVGLAVELYRKDGQKLKQGKNPIKEKGLPLEQLSPSSRLAVVLSFRLNYAAEEVAGFLGESLFSTQMRLWDARQRLIGQYDKSYQARDSQAQGNLLAQALLRDFPAPALSEVDLEIISQEVIGRAQHKRNRQQRAAYWKEISVISAVILIVLVWMGRAHLDAPEATATPPAGIALASGVTHPVRPTRLPSATPSPQPTGTPYAWTGTSSSASSLWTPTPIPEDAFYTVQEGDTLWGIASNLGTSVEALRILNRLPEEAILQPGLRLLKPGSLTLNTPAPSPEPFETQPTPTPLSGPPSPDEILGRWENFPINSLWLDARILYRGPQGYLGEAQTFRMQIWSTLYGELIAAGSDQTTPDTVFKLNFANQGAVYTARPTSGTPWFERNSSEVEIYQYYPILASFLNIQAYHWGDQLIHTVLVGSGKVGDRPAYILRQFDLQQRLLRTIWVDQGSGLPLHIQIYDPNSSRRVTIEMLITGLEVNPDIPQALFNPQIPWLGGYAKDSSGAPFAPGEDQSPWVITPPARINPPYIPAPANLNLATSQLQFQFRDTFSIFPGRDPVNFNQAEIFAGGRYLGPSRLPNPFFTLCARSPDGKRMAFSSAGTGIPLIYSGGTAPGSFIRWIDLSDPETEHIPLTNLQPFSFVFSPDGKQLAVYGEDFDNKRGIYLVDLQNNESHLLEGVDSAASLVWKPDGKQMAFISRSADSPSIASLVVLDVESGEMVSQQSFPEPGNLPAQNVQTLPTLQWGVPFPVGMGDLGACAASPGK